MFRYDRLDELVAETGKKKNYLSTRMGHSGRYLNDAKKQNIQIKRAELEVLAAELGTTPEYLNDETDKKEKPAETNLGERLPGFDDLSEENKVKAREYIEMLLKLQHT